MIEKRIPFSYIFRKVRKELIYVVLVGVIINVVANRMVHKLPEMPLTIPVFLGTAISILLSFKMSQSYDRWWEARKVWGSIVNDSRTLVIQLQTLIDRQKHKELISRIAHRQIAWCYSLGQSLRGLHPLAEMERYLPDEEIRRLAAYTNKPMAMIQFTAEEIAEIRKAGDLDSITHVQLDNTLVRLCDSMGRAERINNTVFPATYRLFLHFSIYLFIITLSVALQNIAIVYEIPLLAAISAVFFLLERTATHLQDPFRNRPSDTPVTAIARTIEINIRELLNEQNIPEPVKPSEFYLM